MSSQRIVRFVRRRTGLAIAVAAAMLLTATQPETRAEDLPIVRTMDSRWELTLASPVDPSRRYVAAAIPAGLYIVARPDFADLRILSVDEQSLHFEEIPFVIRQPVDRLEMREHTIRNVETSRSEGVTSLLVDLGDPPQQVDRLMCEIRDAPPEYLRNVRVFGLSDAASEGTLLTDHGLLYGTVRDGQPVRLSRIEFPPGSYRYYRILIEDNGEPSLAIGSVRAFEHNGERAPRSQHDAAIFARGFDESNRQSIINTDLTYAQLPICGLALDVEFSGDFFRRAHVEVSHETHAQSPWKRVASFDLYRLQPSGAPPVEQLSVEFPEVRCRYIRLIVENGIHKPLIIRSIQVHAIDRWLVFEQKALLDSSRHVAIYAGDRVREAPQYELEKSIGQIDLLPLMQTVKVGSRKANPHKLAEYDPLVVEAQRRERLGWAWFAGITLAVLTAVVVRIVVRLRQSSDVSIE